MRQKKINTNNERQKKQRNNTVRRKKKRHHNNHNNKTMANKQENISGTHDDEKTTAFETGGTDLSNQQSGRFYENNKGRSAIKRILEQFSDKNITTYYAKGYELTNKLMAEASTANHYNNKSSTITKTFANVEEAKENINDLRDVLHVISDAFQEQEIFFKSSIINEIEDFEVKSKRNKQEIERLGNEKQMVERNLLHEKQILEKKIVNLEHGLQELSIRHREDIAQKIYLLKLKWREEMEQKLHVETSREEILEFENTIATLRRDISVLTAELAQIKEGSKRFENTIHVLAREKGYIERSMEKGIHQNSEFRTELEGAKRSIVHYKEKFANMEVKLKNVERKYDEKSDEIIEMRMKLKNTKNELDKKYILIKEKDSKINNLEKEIEMLNISVLGLNNKIHDSSEAFDNSVEKNKSTIHELKQKLKKQNTEYDAKYEKLNNELNDLRNINLNEKIANEKYIMDLQNQLVLEQSSCKNVNHDFTRFKDNYYKTIEELKTNLATLIQHSDENMKINKTNNMNQWKQDIQIKMNQCNNILSNLNINHVLVRNNFKHSYEMHTFQNKMKLQALNKQYEECKEENERLLKIVNSPKNHVVEIEALLKKKVNEYELLEEELHRKDADFVGLDRTARFLKQDIQKYQNTITEQTEKLSKMELEFLNLKSENENNCFALKVSQQSNNDLKYRQEKEIELIKIEHESVVKSLHHEIEIKDTELKNIEEKLEELKLAKAKLKTENPDLQIRIKVEAECKQLRAELKDKSSKLDNKIEREKIYYEEKERLLSTMKELTTELKIAQKTIDELKSKVNDYNLKISQIKHEKSQVEFSYKTISHKADDLKSESKNQFKFLEMANQTLKNELKKKEVVCSKLQNDIRNIILKHNNQMEEKMRLNLILREDYKNLKEYVTKLNADDGEGSNTVNLLKNELEGMKHSLKKCQDDYKGEISKNAKLVNETIRLRNLVVSLEQNVKTNTSDTDVLSSYNKNLKDKCEKMEQSIQSLKLQYEGALNEIDGLTKMNQMMERKYTRVDAELKEFKLHGENKKVLAMRLKSWSERAKNFAIRLKEEAKSKESAEFHQ